MIYTADNLKGYYISRKEQGYHYPVVKESTNVDDLIDLCKRIMVSFEKLHMKMIGSPTEKMQSVVSVIRFSEDRFKSIGNAAIHDCLASCNWKYGYDVDKWYYNYDTPVWL